MFNIGDNVFIARAGTEKVYLTCPDCLGKKYLTVIMGDGSIHTIDCANCAGGYSNPSGLVTSYEYKANVRQDIVKGLSIETNGSVYYRFGDGRSADAEYVFATTEEAQAKADALVVEHTAAEERKMQTKQHLHRSWARNASWHRNEIKRAQKDLDYHIAKLNVAKSKAKGV